jgi:hypothetical protein
MVDGPGMGRGSFSKVTEGVNWQHETLSETAEDGNWCGPSSSEMSSSSSDWRLVSGDDVIHLWVSSLLALSGLCLLSHFSFALCILC